MSPDGANLLYSLRAADGQYDIWRLPLGGGEPTVLRQSRFNEEGARYAPPDGRFFALSSPGGLDRAHDDEPPHRSSAGDAEVTRR